MSKCLHYLAPVAALVAVLTVAAASAGQARAMKPPCHHHCPPPPPVDLTPPTLTLPANITTTATSGSGATVSYSVSATDPDNTPAQLTISCLPPSGSTFPVGTTTVNCTASDPAGNSSSGSFKVTVNPPPPPSPLQPVGDPLGRTWTPVLDDEFNGTSIDTSKWVALNGWGNNNVTSNAKNCSESGGNLILALPGDGTGCDLYSSKTYGAGVNAHDLLVGDYLEARIYFPGSNAPNPSSTSDNWPAFWTYDGSGNWNAGENDIAESLGNVNFYYHGPNGYSRQILPAGNWANSWHVYGLYRDATQVQVFRDGVSIGTVPTTDNGGPQAIMFTSGDSNSCCGSPTVHGSAANVLVDWVREWK